MNAKATELDDGLPLDGVALQLGGAYKVRGIAAFTVRTLPNGNVRLINPTRLPRSQVAQMLRSAAEGLENGAIVQQVAH